MSWAHELTSSWQLADAAERKWKPFAPAGTPNVYLRDRLVDLAHLRAELTLDVPGRGLSGTAWLTVVPIAEPVAALSVDAEELTVTAVSSDAATTVGWHNTGKALDLTFDPPLVAEQAVTVAIEYSATPRRGLHYIAPDEDHPDKRTEVWSQCFDLDARCWVPCLDYPTQKCSTELSVTVPGTWFCLSNGRLVERRTNADGTATFHWLQEVPHSSYLLALAAGEYAEVEDSWDGIPVNYYVPPDRLADGARSFGRTPEMVAFYSDLIGVRYPFAKYAQITATDFRYGGMENTTATVQTWRTLHDERASLDTSSEGLVAHELVHSWFGNLVTCRDWSEAWLNEGFATFFHNAWHRHARGEDEFRYEIYGAMRAFIGEDSGRYRRPLVQQAYKAPDDLFDAHIYQKGASFLNLLRCLLGDRLFYRCIRVYVERHAGRCATTPGLLAAFEETSGRSLGRLFDQWVYKGGHPELVVSYSWDDKRSAATVTLKQTQTPDELTSIFELPCQVRFVGEGLDELRTFELKEAEHSFVVPLAVRPQWVAVDPGNSIPKTLDLQLDEDLLKAQLAADDDVMGRVYAVQALGKKGSAAALEALAQALLNDGYWGVQAECAAALATVRTPAALAALVAAVAVPHPKARRAVARALGAWRSPVAADALLPLAAGDASYFVEAEALDALARTRDERAWDVLAAALERESHHDCVATAALRGLVTLDAERALPLAEALCVPRTRDTLRGPAFGQAARAARESGARDDVKLRVRRMLEEVLLCGHFHEQAAALGALQELRDSAALGAIGALKASGSEPGLAKSADRALAALRDTSGLPSEVKDLRTELDKLKEEAADLKARLAKLEALPAEPVAADAAS